jgi:hypothetical protein
LGWGELAEGTVRPGGVVVPQVLGQHMPQVVLIDDQHPAGELPAQGADDPFADRVRSWSLRRAGHDPDAPCGEHGIEGAGELARTVPEYVVARRYAVSGAAPSRSVRVARPTVPTILLPTGTYQVGRSKVAAGRSNSS